MTQTPFTTDKGEFLAIKFPSGATNSEINHLLTYKKYQNWQIITPNASEATEEQAREIVGSHAGYLRDIKFPGEKYEYTTQDALEWVLSGLGLTGTVTVIKKVK
jgi:hypothetical protein